MGILLFITVIVLYIYVYVIYIHIRAKGSGRVREKKSSQKIHGPHRKVSVRDCAHFVKKGVRYEDIPYEDCPP